MSWWLNQAFCIIIDNMLSQLGLVKYIGRPKTYKIIEVIIKKNSS